MSLSWHPSSSSFPEARVQIAPFNGSMACCEFAALYHATVWSLDEFVRCSQKVEYLWWNIHNLNIDATQQERLHMRVVHKSSARVFGVHVTKRRSDWPELFGLQTTLFAAILLAEVVSW